jgi:hypothetical protein
MPEIYAIARLLFRLRREIKKKTQPQETEIDLSLKNRREVLISYLSKQKQKTLVVSSLII